MKLGHLAARIAVAVACACSGGGNGGGEPDFAPPDDVVDGDAVTDVPPADAPKQPVQVGEDFRVVYGYAGRPVKPELVGRHDLLLADPRDADPENDFSLTEKALKKLDPPLNCDIGCFTDPDMRWLAVATATSKDGTRTLKLGRFLADHQTVNMDKFEGLTGVKHLAFAGDFLFFTKPQPDCQADEGPPTTCFQVFRLDLNTLAKMDLILSFPPPDTLAHSMYAGYFTPSEDGSTLVFMNPTNHSQRVYVWRAGPPGALRKVGDTLCAVPDPQGMPGQCGPGGTLSTYTEKDPVALSPDGKTLVFALVEGDELRLYKHELETDVRTYSVLLSAPSPYAETKCYNRAPWQYTTVLPPLRFTPDGADVVFLGLAACDENREKPWTNIVRIALARIGTGEKLASSDLRLVTDNPTGNVARCVSMSWFDLSPSGEHVTFVGTPTLQDDGKTPIKDTDNRHRSAAEVYVTRTDGTALPVQITNNLLWLATSVDAIATPQ